ncbi:MAG: tol-pal system protein YbgF [Desulfuromonadales bacterium]|nr:tol-pal system protein YbgF [Desulfuromonadales bacterium]
MTSLNIRTLSAYTLLLCCISILSACAPPPSTTALGGSSRDLQQLKAQVSTHKRALNEVNRELAALKVQLQEQSQEIAQLQQSGSTQASASYAPQSKRAPAEAQTSNGGTSPTQVYLQAFGDYASGRYQAAAHGFDLFLQRFPNNSYAANAQFWLGDCYFNQQQYETAITEFQKVVQEHPKADKAPEALLKIAMTLLQLDETEQAEESIATLKHNYPKSPAAKKAQELTLP